LHTGFVGALTVIALSFLFSMQVSAGAGRWSHTQCLPNLPARYSRSSRHAVLNS
jgi:hypothetical protein